jgi:acyl-CoA synthetase (AMP-forming)/AMP-acid ligase II
VSVDPKLSDLLLGAWRQFGTATACEDIHGSVSYAALVSRTEMLAAELTRANLANAEPVLVYVSNEARDLVAFTAVWQAGGVVVPVHRSTPAAVFELTRAKTKARFALDAGSDASLRQLVDEIAPERAVLADAAFVIFTSGSTGRPKGVVLSHRAFGGKLKAIDSLLHFSQRTRSFLVLQITFSFGIWVSLLTLLKGGVLLMHPRFDAETALRDVVSQHATDAAFVPTMLRQFLRLDRDLVARARGSIPLQRILTGGEPLGRHLAGELAALFPNSAIVDIYGLTETSTCDFLLRSEEQSVYPGCIGRPTPGVTFRIADDHGRETTSGETGELQIRTPFIMNGYLDEPELTRAAFSDDFFRTGDLARVRPDGVVELAGRSKELIIRGGNKISPLELDQLLASHPEVAAALTVGVPDPVIGERIHALIIPREHGAIDEAALRQWLGERMEKFKQPDTYHFGTSLPTGRTGKVDRAALRAEIENPRGSPEFSA